MFFMLYAYKAIRTITKDISNRFEKKFKVFINVRD